MQHPSHCQLGLQIGWHSTLQQDYLHTPINCSIEIAAYCVFVEENAVQSFKQRTKKKKTKKKKPKKIIIVKTAATLLPQNDRTYA